MGYWKKHQKKDLERLLCDIDALGWRILDPPTYYKARCPCGLHKTNIHLTPSGANYARNTLKWVQRQSCTKIDEAIKEAPDDLR